MTTITSIALVILGTLVSSVCPIWLKKATAHEFSLKALYRNYYLIGFVFLNIVGLGIFVVALKGGDLSILYPLASLNYVWACLLSVRMLGEKMTAKKWTAIVFIIMGAFFIGLGA